MDKYRIISVRNLGFMVYGMVWLAGVLGLYGSFLKSKSLRQLLTRFGYVVASVAGVWGLSFIFREFLLF